MVKAFYDQVSIVKDHLNDVLNTVEKGIVPSIKEISDCTKSLDKISMRYESIVTNVSGFLSEIIILRMNDYVKRIFFTGIRRLKN